MRTAILLCPLLALPAPSGQQAAGPSPPAPVDPVFRSAIAAWQMGDARSLAGDDALRIAGDAGIGVTLDGDDLRASLEGGNDGRVARLDGGYLDAGQGAGGRLNPSGRSLTVSVRLRCPSGAWDGPIFSKHGGHDRLVYNVYSSRSHVGFELGLRDRPGMTSVLVPLDRIGEKDWHDVVGRYDGKAVQVFVDGVLMDEAPAEGPIREGNAAPCLIGGEPSGGGVKTGWKGLIDHVAIWDRALPAADIERLAGGAASVAARRKRYTQVVQLPPAPDLYRETLRPQFHFTARQWGVRKLNPGMREEGWLNDVNGLIHLDGEYHLMAQRWARCWIHAVSKDLIHWTELQPAFWDDRRYGTGVQSGTAVLDARNVSKLSPDDRTPPLVAFWSGFDNHSQCISYSLDRGRTWAKYAGNPIFHHPERDPKVFWHEPTRRWVMVLSCVNSYLFFTSENLLDWHEEKDPIPDCFECPDFFSLPLDGDPSRPKWVLIRGNGSYSVGEFDGRSFRAQTPVRPGDHGPNFYATGSWGDIAGQPGRRVQIAWMRGGSYPEMPFNQQMSFPCDLSLRTVDGSPRMYRRPAPEIATLHGKEHAVGDLELAPGQSRPLPQPRDGFRLLAEVECGEGATLTFTLRGTKVVIDGKTIVSRCEPVAASGSVRTVEILVDRASIETFANDGEVSISACFLPTDDRLAVGSSGGPARVRSLRIIELESAWPTRVDGPGPAARAGSSARRGLPG
ncbi:Levanase precursor [Aquisphaera giovannonii]|uniref:Levanase n=1 Tax=Aquisphaera giovannonii TaxID=406548 RepID=A0A5B9WA94_9BACT|nr:LamG-like jellyroll fold domain-containing protein [Aquisphaera giovannonii]QEH37159.1 Levanase precursor [Aquisphaera giovannonii]